jgi:hypothetical protein
MLAVMLVSPALASPVGEGIAEAEEIAQDPAAFVNETAHDPQGFANWAIGYLNRTVQWALNGFEDGNDRGNETGNETGNGLAYAIADTGQTNCYDNGRKIDYPKSNEAFYG